MVIKVARISTELEMKSFRPVLKGNRQLDIELGTIHGVTK